jgi:hypothetical protein
VGVREAPTVDWDGKDRPRLISGLRKAGVDERYLHVEWGKVQTAHLAMVRKYADTLPTRVDRGEGILLWGDRGSGKSSIAALVMQEAVKADITCRWWNVTDLQTLFASRTFEKQDNLQRGAGGADGRDHRGKVPAPGVDGGDDERRPAPARRG